MPAIPFIAVAAILAAGAVSAYSTYQQGKSQQQIAEYNAQLAEMEAKEKAMDGRRQAEDTRTQGKRLLAQQRAAYAASGVVADNASPLLVQVETMGEVELAARQAQRNMNIEAYKYTQQARIDRMQGKSAMAAARLGAVAQVLGSVGSAMGSYGSMKKA